jgi:hypothetical protein
MNTLIFSLSLLLSLSAFAGKSVKCQDSKKNPLATTVVIVTGSGPNQSAEIQVFDGKSEGYKILGQYQVTKSDAPLLGGAPRIRFQDQNQKFFLSMEPKANHLRATVANGSKLDIEIKCNEVFPN